MLTDNSDREPGQDGDSDLCRQLVKHHDADMGAAGGDEEGRDEERGECASGGVRVGVGEVGKHREPEEGVDDAEEGTGYEGRPVPGAQADF